MWFHIKNKPTINPENDWTHTTTIRTTLLKDQTSFEESFPISILITASKEKPLYVIYHIDNGTCDIGPLLFTCYDEAYETFLRKIQHQYKEAKDDELLKHVVHRIRGEGTAPLTRDQKAILPAYFGARPLEKAVLKLYTYYDCPLFFISYHEIKMMYPKGYERVNPFLMYRFNHLSYPEYYYSQAFISQLSQLATPNKVIR